MSLPTPLHVYVSEDRNVAANPIIKDKRRRTQGVVPILTVGGSNIPVSFWFYEPDPNSSALVSVRKEGDVIQFVGKLQRVDAEDLLFIVALTAEAQDENDDWFYSGTLNLNTTTCRAVQKDQIVIYCELVVNNELKHQFTAPLRPTAFTGSEVDPLSPEMTMFEELAAEAATSASAANASAVNAAGSASDAADSAAAAEASKDEAAAIAAGIVVDLDAKADKAANPSNALPSFAVDGADLRVNATGGVRTAGLGVTAGYPLTGVEGTVEFTAVVRPDTATGGPFLSTFANIKVNITVISGNWNIVLLQDGPWPWNFDTGLNAATVSWFALTLRRDGVTGEFTVGVNGATPAPFPNNITATPPATDTSAFVQFLGSQFNGYGQYLGDCRSLRIANFALTSDEAEGAAKGESRGRLAYRGQDDMPAAFSNSRFGLPGWDTFSTGANSVTFTSATVTSSCKADLPVQILAGQTLRTTVTVSGYTATTTPINLSAWDRTATTDFAGFVPVTANGTYVLTSLASIASTQAQLCIVCDNPSGGGATFTVISSVVEGTVASYEPANCTSLNRWLDNSGNNHHLLPVGGAKALNPQVPHWRDFVGRFNLATLAEETPEGVIATRQTNPGILRLVFASYMLLSGKRVKAAVSAGLETGQLISLNSVTAPTYIDVHVRKTTDGTYINDEVTYAGAHFE